MNNTRLLKSQHTYARILTVIPSKLEGPFHRAEHGQDDHRVLWSADVLRRIPVRPCRRDCVCGSSQEPLDCTAKVGLILLPLRVDFGSGISKMNASVVVAVARAVTLALTFISRASPSHSHYRFEGVWFNLDSLQKCPSYISNDVLRQFICDLQKASRKKKAEHRSERGFLPVPSLPFHSQ